MRNDWRGGRGLTERGEKRFERKIMICKNKTVRKNKETWRKVWEAFTELTDEDGRRAGMKRREGEQLTSRGEKERKRRDEEAGEERRNSRIHKRCYKKMEMWGCWLPALLRWCLFTHCWTERIVGKDYSLMSVLKKRQVMCTCWWRRPSFCLFLILFLKQKSAEETKVLTLFPPGEVQIRV